ncbi:MAG: hypothetical protein NTY47_08525, partial [Candidatus Omnitrophica bacterium]|nr:hypothetical protein [Candidatus Omnitrophota bacterium]
KDLKSTPQAAAISAIVLLLFGFLVLFYATILGLYIILVSAALYRYSYNAVRVLDAAEVYPVGPGPIWLKTFFDFRPIATTSKGINPKIKDKLDVLDLYLVSLHEATHCWLGLDQPHWTLNSKREFVAELLVSIAEAFLLISIVGAVWLVERDNFVKLVPKQEDEEAPVISSKEYQIRAFKAIVRLVIELCQEVPGFVESGKFRNYMLAYVPFEFRAYVYRAVLKNLAPEVIRGVKTQTKFFRTALYTYARNSEIRINF